MNPPTLPDLLELLAEVFLVPGACDRGLAQDLSQAPALPGPLRGALADLLECPAAELEVTYAGLFLHGATGPTLHLQASAGLGPLAAEAVRDDLNRILAAVNLAPEGRIQVDHLGALLALLAGLFRRLRTEAPDPALEALARSLLHEHLLPLGSRVTMALLPPRVQGFYQAAGRCLTEALGLSAAILV